MQTSPISRVVVVRNQQGLHARPADRFVRLAATFDAQVVLVRDSRRVPATSIMDLLTLGATQGTQLILEATGPAAQQAIEALADLVENVFPQEDTEQDPRHGED